MGETVELTSGTHRRTDDDGTPIVFKAGDVFEATEQELDAFGDKLEPVEKDDGEWVATRSTAGVEEPEDGTYRLLDGTHRTTDDDGNSIVLEPGDEVFLTAGEAEAFGDKFEKVEADDSADEFEDSTETDADGDVESGGDEMASDETATETSESEPDAEDSAEGGETEAALATPDADVKLPAEFPESVPDADEWGWEALREVSKANGVDASQAKPDQVDDLRSIAGSS